MARNIWGDWCDETRDVWGNLVLGAEGTTEDRIFDLAAVLTLTVAQVDDYFQLTMSRDDDDGDA